MDMMMKTPKMQGMMGEAMKKKMQGMKPNMPMKQMPQGMMMNSMARRLKGRKE